MIRSKRLEAAPTKRVKKAIYNENEEKDKTKQNKY